MIWRDRNFPLVKNIHLFWGRVSECEEMRDSWTRRYLCPAPRVLQRCGKPQIGLSTIPVLIKNSVPLAYSRGARIFKPEMGLQFGTMYILSDCVNRPAFLILWLPNFDIWNVREPRKKMRRLLFHISKMRAQILNSSKDPSISKSPGPPHEY